MGSIRIHLRDSIEATLAAGKIPDPVYIASFVRLETGPLPAAIREYIVKSFERGVIRKPRGRPPLPIDDVELRRELVERRDEFLRLFRSIVGHDKPGPELQEAYDRAGIGSDDFRPSGRIKNPSRYALAAALHELATEFDGKVPSEPLVGTLITKFRAASRPRLRAKFNPGH